MIEPSEREMTTMEFIQQANKAAKNIVGAEITVSAEEAGFGTGSPVQVNISGPELDVLNDLAQQLVWVLERNRWNNECGK
ncbi:efflux RND transporter permease subunit [Anaerobacillus sp. HL2]|nr:efflux RND transporter permease subunit [Anaerobacillus sp. HL2]